MCCILKSDKQQQQPQQPQEKQQQALRKMLRFFEKLCRFVWRTGDKRRQVTSETNTQEISTVIIIINISLSLSRLFD